MLIKAVKKVSRRGIWETNSSSSHVVSIEKERRDTTYNMSGDIEIYLDEYGWEGDPCDDILTKLEYAMSMVLHTEYSGFNWDKDFVVDQNKLEGCAGYKLLLDALNTHGNKCDKVVIKKKTHTFYPYGYIDHQSCGYKSLQDFLNDWDIDAERFLWDDNVVVWIDNDNH